jgi:hypothetical protein
MGLSTSWTVAHWFRLFQYGLIVRIRFFSIHVSLRKFLFWRTWNLDSSVLCFDEDRPSGRGNRLTKVRGEPVVPAPPQSRLVWNRPDSQALSKVRVGIEILCEYCFVFPAVQLLQYEEPKEGVHLIAG